jgi:hypothetical protein
MSLVLPVLACALLFAVFGLMRRGREREQGCSTCTTECPAKELRHGHP